MRVFALASIVPLAPALGGCFFLNETNGSGSGGGNTNQAEIDVKDYDKTQAELDQHRSVFLKSGRAT